MKWKKVLICFGILTILYLQYGRAPIVNHAFTNRNTHGCDTSLAITVNKLFILNKKLLTRKLTQQIQDNAFPNMQLSPDALDRPMPPASKPAAPFVTSK
jgi:hypothetical protein